MFATLSLDVLCLQEPRACVGNSPSQPHSGIARAFKAALSLEARSPVSSVHVIARCQPVPEDPANPELSSKTGVVTIISAAWDVDRVEHHSSGRAVAVSISRGKQRMAIVNLYVPTDMDHTRVGSTKWELAQELYGFARTFVEDFDLFFVCGDLNETAQGMDRIESGQLRDARGARVTRPQGCLVREISSGDGPFRDAYRELHPDDPGFTWEKAGSFSRIDYIMIPPRLLFDTRYLWTCEVLAPFLSYNSCHSPLLARVSAESNELAVPGEPRVFDGGQEPRPIWIQHAKPAALDAFARDCEEAGLRMEARWIQEDTRLGKPCGKRGKKRYRACATEFLSMVSRKADGRLEGGGRRKPTGESRPLSPLEKVRAIKEKTLELRRAIGSTNRAADGKGLSRLVGELRALHGKNCRLSPNDLKGIRALVDKTLAVDQTTGLMNIDGCILREFQQSTTTAKRMRRDFRHNPGKFFEHYLRGEGQRGGPPDRATMPDGTVSWNPEEYLPVIQEAVYAPFSEKVDMPTARGLPPAKPLDPHESLDVRDTGELPWWWDATYARDAKQITADIYARLMAQTCHAEVIETLHKAAKHKAAGKDRVSIDLTLVITDPKRLGTRGSELRGGYTSCLRIITALVNLGLKLKYVPPELKHGIITLVPKANDDGTSSREPQNMRPITVLPELGKLTSRILAHRLGNVLLTNAILSDAQRGFLRDGCVDQCIDAVLDSIEDWKSREKKAGKWSKPLYVLALDQSKAYDSVQQYTIRASMERFNLPESFIQFVLSSLTDAVSQVRTKGGLTEPFTIMSGVRQGDPLAPLIYILITDAFHEGLKNNPFSTVDSKQGGYTFRRNDAGREVRVYSSGYADDSITIADSRESQEEMHSWVRSFYGAHAFRLNAKKSKFLCSGTESGAPIISSVDGRVTVKPIASNISAGELEVDLEIGEQKTQTPIVDREPHNESDNYIGQVLEVPACWFGDSWARQTFGAAWKTVTLEYVVTTDRTTKEGSANRQWGIQSVADPTEVPAIMLSTAVKLYLRESRPRGHLGDPKRETQKTRSITHGKHEGGLHQDPQAVTENELCGSSKTRECERTESKGEDRRVTRDSDPVRQPRNTADGR